MCLLKIPATRQTGQRAYERTVWDECGQEPCNASNRKANTRPKQCPNRGSHQPAPGAWSCTSHKCEGADEQPERSARDEGNDKYERGKWKQENSPRRPIGSGLLPVDGGRSRHPEHRSIEGSRAAAEKSAE
jgi:hypothetical protein